MAEKRRFLVQVGGGVLAAVGAMAMADALAPRLAPVVWTLPTVMIAFLLLVPGFIALGGTSAFLLRGIRGATWMVAGLLLVRLLAFHALFVAPRQAAIALECARPHSFCATWRESAADAWSATNDVLRGAGLACTIGGVAGIRGFRFGRRRSRTAA